MLHPTPYADVTLLSVAYILHKTFLESNGPILMLADTLSAHTLHCNCRHLTCHLA